MSDHDRGAATNILEIQNQGQDITRTNFWGSEIERAGKMYCSVNAGAVRLLLPRLAESLLKEWGSPEYVILSRGPWPAQGIDEAVELLFEDHTSSPYALHLTANSFDLLPAEPEAGREWIFSAWVAFADGTPHKAKELPCKWRRSGQLPDLSPW